MKHIIAGLIVILILSSPSTAQTLTYKDVLKQAIERNHELKIAKVDIGISKAGIKEARSEYFPAITLGYNAGYQRDLSENNSAITPVGDSILLNETQFRNSASAGLQYNLFDFGARGKRLKIAKKDKIQKQTRYSMNMRDLKLQLADIYTKALLNYREYTANKKILNLNSELFNMQERLFTAGKKNRTDVVEQAIKVAKITNEINSVRIEYRKNLEDISFYTGTEYDIDSLELEFFEEPGFEPVNFERNEEETVDSAAEQNPKLQIEAVKTDFLNEENLPEYKYYQLEIEKKQAELAVLNRQRFPQFRFYTNYYLYGTDSEDYWGTFSDLGQTNLSFRISSSLPVFTGFKNTAQRDRTKLEMKKLKLQRDQKLEEMKTYYQKMYRQSRDYKEVLSAREKSLALVEEKITMLERLGEQELIDRITYLSQKSDLISQKLELEKVKINNSANEYKINILKMTEDELCKRD